MIDTFKYTDGIVRGVLSQWNVCSRPTDRVYEKLHGVHWLIPADILKVDVARGIKFLKEEYNELHYSVLCSVYLEQKTRKDVMTALKLTHWEYYRTLKTAVTVITEFLNGEWRKD